MNWEELNAKFRNQFPDYTVSISPPCISANREYQYIMDAKAVALGLKENPSVTIDHKKKKITFMR